VPVETAYRFAIDPVIPLPEAAIIAGCHKDTLKAVARRGKLEIIQVSQRRFGIRQSELDRYLSECKRVA
jgi:hypothetical protein